MTLSRQDYAERDRKAERGFPVYSTFFVPGEVPWWSDHSNNHFAPGVFFFKIPKSISCFTKWISSINDRFDLSVFQKLFIKSKSFWFAFFITPVIFLPSLIDIKGLRNSDWNICAGMPPMKTIMPWGVEAHLYSESKWYYWILLFDELNKCY